MKRMIKKYVKKLFRWLFSGKRSRTKTWVITYLLALLPANYVTTAVTTASSLANPAQVLQVMQNTEALTSLSGIINTATGGLMKPLYNGTVAAVGSAAQAIGNTFGLNSMVEAGKEWVSGANEWFTAGQSALSDIQSSSISLVDSFKRSTDMADQSAAAVLGNVSPESNYYTWDASIAPDYYKVEGLANTADQTVFNVGEYKYADLDQLGRSGVAEAIIGIDAINASAGTREEFEKGSNPSGWGHNAKVSVKMTNGKTYNGYAFNRSHLIADSLGGRAYRNNLITGSRMQNVGANDLKGGMQYIERKVLDHVKDNPSVSVWYRVTPIYEANNLVPIAVIVDAVSNDGFINERVITYNVLPGYTINYQTGEFSKN